MRRGSRRGQSIADALRIVLRNDAAGRVDSPESSPDTPGSAASTPSPTTTAFREVKTDTPSPTKTTFPPPAVTTTDSPSPTTTTFPLPAATTTDSPSPTTTTFPPSLTTRTDSPSPTKTTFPPAITSSAVPFLNHPEISSTSNLPVSAVPTTFVTFPSSFPPTQAKPSPTNIALAPAVSDSTSLLPTSLLQTSRLPITASTTVATAAHQLESTTAAATFTSVIAAADSVSVPTDGLGPTQYRDNGKVHLDAGAVAGIAVGSSIGTMVIAAILFIIWRKWNKRAGKGDSDKDSSSGSVSGVRQYLSRRFTHRSDDRIMNELMQGAYSAENGARESYMNRMPVGPNGYLEEKKRGMEDDEMPILQPEPQRAAQPGFKRTKRISRWLGKHDSEMLNPNLARASFVSNATGLRTLDLRSMSGWGSDDGYSEYDRATMPPTKLQPAPVRVEEDPGVVEVPEPLKLNKEEPPEVQGLGVRVRDSTPIAQFPSPEELKLPPSIGRPPSVAARTEVTGRSSGTWNTWGVMQHRDQPKSWKDKLGM